MKGLSVCRTGRAVLVGAVVAAVVLAAGPLQASTIYVSTAGNDVSDGLSWATAKKTVQAGLNAAASGDQVWVAAGTYYGSITLKAGVGLYGGFARGETDLSQRNWTVNVTVLDGNQAGSVVTCPSGATASTRIDGFTITNGSGTLSSGETYGGGLYLASSSPTITNNAISGNSATYGGGVYVYDLSSPTIANNTISGNSASYGGGLYLNSHSSLTIANNTISGNGAYDGGGVYLGSSSATIVNNTISGNSAYDGGGVYSTGDASLVIVNAIVAFNSSGVYKVAGSGSVSLRCNCVFGNSAYDYSGMTDPTGTSGNIKADPMLADPAYHNCHIQPGSPCIDAGTNADVQSGWLDIDGQPRRIGARVDIGADESDGTAWTGGPYRIVRVSPGGNDTNDGSSWSLPKRTVQAGIDAVAAVGGEVWAAGGTYGERVVLRPYAYVYGGFAGTETQRDRRNWTANVTILDGQHQGAVVTACAGHRISAIDGFTITNGSGNQFGSEIYGGGVYLIGASPTVVNNTIAANAVTGSYAAGGGLYAYCSSATIANNIILGNAARGSTYALGGGMCLLGSSPTITNNTIAGNSASNGGGMYVDFHSSPTITNNTIVGNSASSFGGLYLLSSSLTIANSIVAFNSSGIFCSFSPIFRCNCVYGNTAYDYSGVTDPTGTNGNIKIDPKFVSASPGPDGKWGTADDVLADLRLAAGSPCIDAGSNADVPADAADLNGNGNVTEPLPYDLAGNPRFVDDPTAPDTGIGTAPIVDIGAYERQHLIADVDGDWRVDVIDLLWLIDTFGKSAGDPAYNAACDFNGDGAVDVIDLLVMIDNFGK